MSEDAGSQVEAHELLAEAAGVEIAKNLGEDASLEDVQEALERFPTDWHREKAVRGFEGYRKNQGWNPLEVDLEKRAG